MPRSILELELSKKKHLRGPIHNYLFQLVHHFIFQLITTKNNMPQCFSSLNIFRKTIRIELILMYWPNLPTCELTVSDTALDTSDKSLKVK